MQRIQDIFSKWGLLPQVLVAMVLGVLLSFCMPEWGIRGFVTFNALFANYLALVIPMLIIALIVPSIFELGKGAGALLAFTVGLSYVLAVVAGFMGLGVGELLSGFMMPSTANASGTEMASTAPFFTIEMPAFIHTTSAVVVAFILGITLTYVRGNVIRRAMVEFRDIINMIIDKSIIPLLPIYVFGAFLDLCSKGSVWTIFTTYGKISLVAVVLIIIWITLQYLLAGAIAQKSPFEAMWQMVPVFFTAMGTQSSAATIPVTLAHVRKLGVSKRVAEFVVPLCATINVSAGGLVGLLLCTCIANAYGISISLQDYIGFIFMIGVACVASPGVPGGFTMALMSLAATMLGFDPTAQGVIVVLLLLLDGVNTACNVTSDGAMALIVDKMTTEKIPEAEAILLAYDARFKDDNDTHINFELNSKNTK